MTYAPDVNYDHRRDVRRSVTYAERVTYAWCVTYSPDVTYVCRVAYAGRDLRPERDLRTRCETSDLPNGPTFLIRTLLLKCPLDGPVRMYC